MSYGFERNDVAKMVAWAFVCFFPLTVGLTIEWYKSYKMDVDCIGHLKRASDANSVELAKKELKTAIDYLEKNDITEGTTGVFLFRPSNDVSFWYSNLKVALEDLNRLPSNVTELEKSNVLIKLRETLLDHDQTGDVITVPSDIQFFPYNGFWLFVETFGTIWFLLCCTVGFFWLIRD